MVFILPPLKMMMFFSLSIVTLPVETPGTDEERKRLIGKGAAKMMNVMDVLRKLPKFTV